MAYIRLEDIIESAMPEADVDVPEWGGQVRVRAITSAEIARARRGATRKDGVMDEVELTARIVEAGCVEPSFGPGQFQVLMGKSLGPLNRIATRILELSGVVEQEGAPLGEA